MVGSSSSSYINPWIGQAVFKKLMKTNHALWKAQVLVVVRGARLEAYLTGEAKAPPAQIKDKTDAPITNTEYTDWAATDQQILGFQLANMSRDILIQVASCKTDAEV